MNWKKYKKAGYKQHSASYKSSYTPTRIFHYKNKKKLKIFEKFKIKLLVVSLIFLAIFIVYLLFFSKLFLIKNIEVIGNQTINTQEIKDIVQDQMFRSRFIIFNQQNRFFIDKQELINTLSDQFKLSNISVEAGLSTITVRIEENESAIAWKVGEDLYYLDLNGIIIKKITVNDIDPEDNDQNNEEAEDLKECPVILDNSMGGVWIGKKVIEPDEIYFILDLNNKLKEINQFKIKCYKVDDKWMNEVRVETEQSWEIYFNTNEDSQTQINNLIILLNEKIQDRSGLNYIDLRFGNRVYYK